MKARKQNKQEKQNRSELQSRSEQASGEQTLHTPHPTINTSEAPEPTPHSAFNETAPTGPWRGVFFDGPQPDQDHEGEEIPVWVVYVGDEEAEPTGTVYHVYSFTRAQALAERIAKDRQLELIHEAATA